MTTEISQDGQVIARAGDSEQLLLRAVGEPSRVRGDANNKVLFFVLEVDPGAHIDTTDYVKGLRASLRNGKVETFSSWWEPNDQQDH